MRGAKHNMSWTEIGATVKKVTLLPPKFQALIAAARKRGHKWFAARYVRVDKAPGGKKQIGFALWIPKPEILAFSQTGIFVGETEKKTDIRYARSHPLARTIKEAHHAEVFSDWKRKGWRSHGYPTFAHWLEYREIRERAKKGFHGYQFWRDAMSRRWRDPMGHRAWPKYPGYVQKMAHYNKPSRVRSNHRLTVQYYRDKSGVIRRWGSGTACSLPDRHVLIVDYKYGGIFETWKRGGDRGFELVKRLD